MALQYMARKNHFLKLRYVQLHAPSFSYGVKRSTLCGEDKAKIQVTDITRDYSTLIKPQHCPNTKSNFIGDHNTLLCTPVNVSFQHYQRDSQRKERQNSKSSILTAACLYLGAVLLGSSSAFCDAQNSEDVDKESECLEDEECPMFTKSRTLYSSSRSGRHEELRNSSSTNCYAQDNIISSSDTLKFANVLPRATKGDVFPMQEKLDNLQTIQPVFYNQIDSECHHCKVNLIPTDSSVLHQNPAVHLDGKSDGDSSYKQKLQNAISRSTAILKSKLTMSGAVGASVAVMLDGELVWSQGLGYCHVESATTCSCHSKYRIASISKSITAIIAMTLWEDGLLDLDAPISKYLPDWPKKTVDGKEVTITTRHLLTHSSGIRHYSLKKPSKNSEYSNKKEAENKTSVSAASSKENKSGKKENSSQDDERENFKKYVESRREALIPQLNYYKVLDEKASKRHEEDDGADLWEYYIDKPYESVAEAVNLFKDDDLFFTPGSGFLYTSHGYVLLSRVLEAASGTPFLQLAENFFQNVGLSQTQLDTPRAIVPRRAACYERDEQHELRNAPHVNNSYKWAGGGFLSSAVDLVRLGSVMLYSLHATDHMIQEHNVQPGFLKSSTVQKMWSPYFYHKPSQAFTQNFVRGYGLGWCIQAPRMDQYEKMASASQGSTSGKIPIDGTEDDSFVRISTPWGSKRRRSSRVPPEPKVAQNEEGSVGDTLEDGDKVALDTDAPLKELPGVKSAIQKVSKSATKEAKVKASLGVIPESELEESGWVEGDPIGGRDCRGCCRCGCFAAYHTGAAVGGSSILLIMPQPSGDWLVQRQQSDTDQSDDGENLKSVADQSSTGKNLKAVDSGEERLKNTEKDSRKLDKKKEKKVRYRSVIAPSSSWNECRLCESKRDSEVETNSDLKEHAEVQGIVVAILTNYTGVGFRDEAFKIAREFAAVTS